MPPVAPRGWPMAIAPPLTLIFSHGTYELSLIQNGNCGKCLIDLKQVDLIDSQAGNIQYFPGGGHGTGQHNGSAPC